MGKGSVSMPPVIIPPKMDFSNPYNDVPSQPVIPKVPDVPESNKVPLLDTTVDPETKKLRQLEQNAKFSVADTLVTSPLQDSKSTKKQLKSILG